MVKGVSHNTVLPVSTLSELDEMYHCEVPHKLYKKTLGKNTKRGFAWSPWNNLWKYLSCTFCRGLLPTLAMELTRHIRNNAQAIKHTSKEDYAFQFFPVKWHDHNNPTVNEINRKGKESYKNLFFPSGTNILVRYHRYFVCSKLSL